MRKKYQCPKKVLFLQNFTNVFFYKVSEKKKKVRVSGAKIWQEKCHKKLLFLQSFRNVFSTKSPEKRKKCEFQERKFGNENANVTKNETFCRVF